MALSGDDQNVPRLQRGKSALQCFTPRTRIQHLCCPSRAGEHLFSNRIWVFRAGIVIGHPDTIAKFFGNAAHDGPLLRIAVAPASEQRVKL